MDEDRRGKVVCYQIPWQVHKDATVAAELTGQTLRQFLIGALHLYRPSGPEPMQPMTDRRMPVAINYNVPGEVHRDAKVAAMRIGITMRAFVIGALQAQTMVIFDLRDKETHPGRRLGKLTGF